MEITNEKQQISYKSNKVAQNQTDNPLGISNEDIQKVLQVKCKKHPQSNAYYLHLISDVENARICNMCLKQDDISRKSYEDIREIFKEQSKRELVSYPVLTNSESSERIQNIDNSMDSEAILMDSYFLELSREIQVKIEGKKKAKKLKLMKCGDIYQRSKVCWSEIIDLENLQQILLENNEEKLAQFVRNHVSNAERNTQKIKEVFGDIFDEFSVEQPNKIRSLVCQLLGEIDFNNGAHSSPLHTIEQSDEYRNALQRKQKELEDYQSQINQAQRTILEQHLLLEEMRNLKGKHQNEIITLRQENSDQKQEISSLKQVNQAIKKENSDFKQENSTIKQQLNLEKESNANLREQLDREKKSIQFLNQHLINIKNRIRWEDIQELEIKKRDIIVEQTNQKHKFKLKYKQILQQQQQQKQQQQLQEMQQQPQQQNQQQQQQQNQQQQQQQETSTSSLDVYIEYASEVNEVKNNAFTEEERQKQLIGHKRQLDICN